MHQVSGVTIVLVEQNAIKSARAMASVTVGNASAILDFRAMIALSLLCAQGGTPVVMEPLGCVQATAVAFGIDAFAPQVSLGMTAQLQCHAATDAVLMDTARTGYAFVTQDGEELTVQRLYRVNRVIVTGVEFAS